MTHPTPADRARDVVTRPEMFARQPAVLASAWADLKAARGQSVDFDQLGDPQHRIGTNAPAEQEAEAFLIRRAQDRARGKIRNRIAALGLHQRDGGAA